jgi:hypothetical protein
MSKAEVLKKVFYDSRTGFGSAEQTFKSAKALDPTITKQDVTEFLQKQEIRQGKKPRKNQVNSFVADFPRQEFQIDLLDMGKDVKPFRYGLVCVDIFSKKGACIPIRAKTPEITAKAMKQVFEDLGYPASIMCDDGSEFKGAFAELCKEEHVDIVLSITGGRFVERFIRTLKYDLHQRTMSLKGSWDKYVYDVVDKYNETPNATTKEAPDKVADNEYDFKLIQHVHDNMMSKARFPVKHPEIEVGDHVKIRIKQKAFYKETFNSWSSEVYVVKSIANSPHGMQYYLEGYKRPLLRFELKKVSDVQHLQKGELQSKIKPQAPEEVPKFKRLRPIKEDPVFDSVVPVEAPKKFKRLRPIIDDSFV